MAVVALRLPERSARLAALLRRRRWLGPLLGLTVLVALAVLWTGVRVLQVRSALEGARASLNGLQTSAPAGDVAKSQRFVFRAQKQSRRAHQLTDGPTWSLASHLPLVGEDLQVTADLSATADSLAINVLPGALKGAQLVAAQRAAPRGSLDLASFQAAAGPLRSSLAGLVPVREELVALESRHVAGTLHSAVASSRKALDRLTPRLTGALAAAEVVPPMLGADSPKRYFLDFQNNAESRASGGLISAYGIVSAVHGKVTLERTGVNDDLKNLPVSPLKLGADFDARYAATATSRFWLNSNCSPDFPTTGKIMTSLWNATEPDHVDGVLALDPVAISYLLQASGPFRLDDGTLVTSKNVVDLMLRQLYVRYPTGSTPARTRFLQQIIQRSFAVLTEHRGDPGKLGERLGRAVIEGHLQVFSADAASERVLRTTSIAGALPANRENVLGLVTQNLAGSKLDYYLRRTIRYTAADAHKKLDLGHGLEPIQSGDLTVTLQSRAPSSGLPPYVVSRSDKPTDHPPVGQNRLWVSVYLGRGAVLSKATVDGMQIAMTSEREQGLTVVSTFVDLDPGQTLTLHLSVLQPVSTAGLPLDVIRQPLAFPDQVKVVGTRALIAR